MRVPSGTLVGPYEILAPLGEGETGTVYRALDRRVGRTVALEFLTGRLIEDRELALRFERDARALASLTHRNIVSIHDFDIDAKTPFIASELVEGETLRARMRSGIPWKKALEIAAAVGDGLAMAHARGLAHGDLNPENVLIARDGTAKVLDFATARLKETVSGPESDGARRRRIAYVAPEQVRGEEPSAASDLFSLGVILHEMIAGANPFARATPEETLEAILDREPPSLRSPLSEIPAELDLLVRSCLEKESDERRDSAVALAEELREIQRDAAVPPAARARRRRRLYATAAVAVMALAAFMVASRSKVAHLLGVAGEPPASMVVLPFANGSGADLDFVSDGLTETLIAQMSRVRTLRVISPATSFAFKGSQRDPVDIGRDLAVRAIVTGRVDIEGDRLLVQVTTIDAVTRAELSAKTIALPRERIAEIPGAVARTIAKDLRLEVAHADASRIARAVTPSEEAFDLYLRGLKELSDSGAGRERAILHLEKAVRADPGFARAHAILGEMYLRSSATEDPESMREKARWSISRALEIDPLLAEGHEALGLLRYWDEWALDAAEAEFRRAVELNPSLAASYGYRSSLLLYRGWFDAAIEQARRARDLDPLSLPNGLFLVRALLASDRLDDAQGELLRLAQAVPDSPAAHDMMGRLHERRGEGSAACREFVRARELTGRDSLTLVARLSSACAGGGLDAYRRELLSVLRDAGAASNAFEMAATHAALGEERDAYHYFQIAYEARSDGILAIGIDPSLAPLRSDPRVASLLRRAGVLQTIEPQPLIPLRASVLSGEAAKQADGAQQEN